MKQFETLILTPPQTEQIHLRAHVIITLEQPNYYCFPSWEIEVVEEATSGFFLVIRTFYEFVDFSLPPRVAEIRVDKADTAHELAEICRYHEAVMSALYEQGYLERIDINRLIEQLNRTGRSNS